MTKACAHLPAEEVRSFFSFLSLLSLDFFSFLCLPSLDFLSFLSFFYVFSFLLPSSVSAAAATLFALGSAASSMPCSMTSW